MPNLSSADGQPDVSFGGSAIEAFTVALEQQSKEKIRRGCCIENMTESSDSGSQLGIPMIVVADAVQYREAGREFDIYTHTRPGREGCKNVGRDKTTCTQS